MLYLGKTTKWFNLVDNINMIKTFEDNDWVANFQVNKKSTFFETFNFVRNYLKPKPTKLRARVPITTDT